MNNRYEPKLLSEETLAAHRDYVNQSGAVLTTELMAHIDALTAEHKILLERLESENSKLSASLMQTGTAIRWLRNPSLPTEERINELENSAKELRNWQHETIEIIAPILKRVGLL